MKPYLLMGILLAGAVGTGCVMAPAMPGGPLQGTSVQGEIAGGMSYASATITDHLSDGTTVESRKTEVLGGPAPGRFGARVGVTDWADAAVDYSWADWGFEARVGEPEWTSLPFAVSVGQRYGIAGIGGGHPDHFERRVRGELYPKLWTRYRSRAHLITSLGLSAGDRAHTFGDDPDTFWTIREETRLDAALGLEIRDRLGVFSVVALPYVVLDHGPTYDLAGVSALDLDNNWGIAVFVKAGLSFTFHRFTGGVIPERKRSEAKGLGQ